MAVYPPDVTCRRCGAPAHMIPCDRCITCYGCGKPNNECICEFAGRGEEDHSPKRIMGCICPPGANMTCENPLCPRKAIPGFTAT